MYQILLKGEVCGYVGGYVFTRENEAKVYPISLLCSSPVSFCSGLLDGQEGVRTRTRTNTNPNDTEANAAGRSYVCMYQIPINMRICGGGM